MRFRMSGVFLCPARPKAGQSGWPLGAIPLAICGYGCRSKRVR